MAEDKSTKTPTDKVFDVAKPNATPAQATSRPIIVGHTGVAQKDPMMVEDEVEESSKKLLEKPKSELKLDPISDMPKNEPKVEDQTNNASTDTAEKSNTSNSSAVVDAVLENVTTKKDKLDEADQQLQKEQAIQSLIDSRQYYVKTKTPKSKRNMRWLIILMFIAVLGGLGWYFGYGPGLDMWT